MAEHLAHNYGSQAHELAKMVQLTGKRWPLFGKRLVADMPFIESEVRQHVGRGCLYFLLQPQNNCLYFSLQPQDSYDN